uniref:WW domain-containing protein n=2 Tax=Aureoumbra lagunensis TaxID=44058 RepID=A0A6S8CCB7_9STRA|mmetsp:Transcript_16941/g.21952  ORF Transcript_16941/g.21952 Transcript_16941/m.21952 type:complete len:602 (-) Transcript_16941:1260-3065(-)
MLDQLGSEGEGSLHVLAKKGSLEGVEMLLKLGADVNLKDKNFRLALHAACDINADNEDELDGAYGSCVQLLLEAGSLVNEIDIHGETPLHVAVKSNKYICVQKLINAGASMLIVNIDGNTPLHLAVLSYNLRLIKVLAKNKEEGPSTTPSIMNDQTNLGTLAAMAIYEKFKKKQKNLSHVENAQFDKPKKYLINGQTWTEFWTENNENYFYNENTHTSEWLLPPEENIVNRTTDEEQSIMVVSPPIHKKQEADFRDAIGELDLDKIKYFLNVGISPNSILPSKKGNETPLHLISQVQINQQKIAAAAVHLFCDYGANTEANDNDLNTPLHISALYGNDQILAALLDAGADAAATNKAGDTPLHLAVRSNNFDCFKLLVQYGAPLNALNQYGYSPRTLCNTISPQFFTLFQQNATTQDTFLLQTSNNNQQRFLKEQETKVIPIPPPVDDNISLKFQKKSSLHQKHIMTDRERTQGFRDPPNSRIRCSMKTKQAPGCSNSLNPFYISSPNASSTPLSPSTYSPDPERHQQIKSDLDNYRRSEQHLLQMASPRNKREVRVHIPACSPDAATVPVLSPLAAGSAAPDLILRLSRIKQQQKKKRTK